MFSNPIGKLAVLLIVVGAVLLTGPVFGFSSFAADRGVSVNSAGDDTAYLGIDTVYAGQEVTTGESQPLIRLENRFNETLGGSDGVVNVNVVDVSGDVTNDSAFVVDNRPEIDPGTGANIEVICADDSVTGKSVDITLEIVEASGSSVAVTERVVGPVNDVQIKCQKTDDSQTGLSSVWVSDLGHNEGSESQTFEFTLANDMADGETVTIDLSDPKKVEYGGADVSIDGPGSAQVTGKKSETITYTASDGGVSAGTTIVLDVTGIDTTDKNAAGTHEVTLWKDGEPDSETTTFTVE